VRLATAGTGPTIGSQRKRPDKLMTIAGRRLAASRSAAHLANPADGGQTAAGHVTVPPPAAAPERSSSLNRAAKTS